MIEAIAYLAIVVTIFVTAGVTAVMGIEDGNEKAFCIYVLFELLICGVATAKIMEWLAVV